MKPFTVTQQRQFLDYLIKGPGHGNSLLTKIRECSAKLPDGFDASLAAKVAEADVRMQEQMPLLEDTVLDNSGGQLDTHLTSTMTAAGLQSMAGSVMYVNDAVVLASYNMVAAAVEFLNRNGFHLELSKEFSNRHVIQKLSTNFPV